MMTIDNDFNQLIDLDCFYTLLNDTAYKYLIFHSASYVKQNRKLVCCMFKKINDLFKKAFLDLFLRYIMILNYTYTSKVSLIPSMFFLLLPFLKYSG